MAEPSTTSQSQWSPSWLTALSILGHLTLDFVVVILFVLDQLHPLPRRASDRLASTPRGRVAQRAESAAASPVGRSEHAATPVDAIIDNVEVVVAGELVFVYAVKPTLLRCAAEAIAVGDETCIL
jgi:hypothetical protein